jgi:hypothetical protein
MNKRLLAIVACCVLMSQASVLAQDKFPPADGREVTETQQGRTTVSSIHWTADSLVFSARTKAETWKARFPSGTSCRPAAAAFGRSSRFAVEDGIKTMCGYSSASSFHIERRQ